MTETIDNLPVGMGVTEAAIAELAQRHAGLVCTNPEEREVVWGAVKECTGLRTKVENLRKELKAPGLEYHRKVDAEAKRVVALIKNVESPVKAVLDAYDKEQARIEAAEAAAEHKRVSDIQATINGMGAPLRQPGMPLADLRTALAEIEAREITPAEFQEFTAAANTQRLMVIVDLQKAVEAAEIHERTQEENRLLKERLAKAEAKAALTPAPVVDTEADCPDFPEEAPVAQGKLTYGELEKLASDLVDHLEWIGWGDRYESSAAREQGLTERAYTFQESLKG